MDDPEVPTMFQNHQQCGNSQIVDGEYKSPIHYVNPLSPPFSLQKGKNIGGFAILILLKSNFLNLMTKTQKMSPVILNARGLVCKMESKFSGPGPNN